MGYWHTKASRRAGGRVVAIVDRNPTRAEALAAGVAGSCAVRDLDEVVDRVDVVHICTPTATHVALTTFALEARRHVLVEKPLATSAPAAAALLDLATRQGVLLCPVHQFLFQDGVESAIARLPAIGPLRHISFATCSAGADAAGQLEADDVALEILPHPLSLLARLLPATNNIEWSVRHPAPGEIRALAQAGDVTCSLLISMSGRPTTNALELIGARGTTFVDLFHGFAVTHPGGVSRLRKAARPFMSAAATAGAAGLNLAKRSWRTEPAYPGLRRLLQLFYRAAAGDGACPIPPAETFAVARESDRLRQLVSAATATSV